MSPLFADLEGMPPSLLITSTRDLLLSDTTMFHRALLRAGNDAQLVVFEALPHAFWYHFQLPETKECVELMAKFFDQKLARQSQRRQIVIRSKTASKPSWFFAAACSIPPSHSGSVLSRR